MQPRWLLRFPHLASLDEFPGLPVFNDIVHNRYDRPPRPPTKAFLDTAGLGADELRKVPPRWRGSI